MVTEENLLTIHIVTANQSVLKLKIERQFEFLSPLLATFLIKIHLCANDLSSNSIHNAMEIETITYSLIILQLICVIIIFRVSRMKAPT